MSSWTFEQPNPIERCTIQLVFSAPLPAPIIRDLASLHIQFKRDLPRKIEQQALTLQFGGILGTEIAPPSQEIAGLIFDFVNPTGESARAFVVGPNSITYFTREYTRWNEFWPFASRLLVTASRGVLSSIPLSILKLEYRDRFDWDGEPDSADVNLLFIDGCRYIAEVFRSHWGLVIISKAG